MKSSSRMSSRSGSDRSAKRSEVKETKKRKLWIFFATSSRVLNGTNSKQYYNKLIKQINTHNIRNLATESPLEPPQALLTCSLSSSKSPLNNPANPISPFGVGRSSDIIESSVGVGDVEVSIRSSSVVPLEEDEEDFGGDA